MPNPGHYWGSYYSYFQSKYHIWFQHMGYPELDVLEYPDGSFFVIQYYSSPVVPSLTRWQSVLGPIKNVEKSYGFFEKYALSLDITKKAFWERENKKSQMVDEEFEAAERHAEDIVERASQAFLRNPHVMERIAKNGLREMDLRQIERHVPKSEII